MIRNKTKLNSGFAAIAFLPIFLMLVALIAFITSSDFNLPIDEIFPSPTLELTRGISLQPTTPSTPGNPTPTPDNITPGQQPTSVVTPPDNTSGNTFFSSLYGHSVPNGILDGSPKTFVVSGYSTSNSPDANNAWPAILQRMLDQHSGGQRTYYVYSRVKGSSPLARWTDTCSDFSLIDDVINEFNNIGSEGRNGVIAPQPHIILAQQSTQWAFDCNNRLIEIEVAEGETPGPEDQDRIQTGANEIKKFTDRFLTGSFEKVYMGMHIYTNSTRDSFPYHLYGERFALERALNMGITGLVPGPQLWSITKWQFENVPNAFQSDGRHPDLPVAHSMALYWYLILAGDQANPDVYNPIANVAQIQVPSADQ